MKIKIIRNQHGVAHVAVFFLIALVLLVTVATGFKVYQANSSRNNSTAQELSNPVVSTTTEETTLPPAIPEEIAKPPTSLTTPQPTKNPVTSSVTYPVIKGDSDCQSQTKSALDLLYEKARSHYNVVMTYVAVIECSEQGSGMYAYEAPPRFLAGKATRDAGTVWYAGTIVHDAGHSKLYNDYKKGHPSDSVPDDIWTGRAAEATCLAVQSDALEDVGADQSTIDYVKGALETGYYDVPYAERWW